MTPMSKFPAGPYVCTFCTRPAEYFAPHADGQGHVRVCPAHARVLTPTEHR